MKDDRWVARFATEYLYLKLMHGGWHPPDMHRAEERMEYIEDMFYKRFGTQRGKILLSELKDYNF